MYVAAFEYSKFHHLLHEFCKAAAITEGVISGFAAAARYGAMQTHALARDP